VARAAVQLVAATDNNKQGDIYADRLLAIGEESGCYAERLRSVGYDWNVDLKMRTERGEDEEEANRVPHARRSPQG
jgi:hypothetical protein